MQVPFESCSCREDDVVVSLAPGTVHCKTDGGREARELVGAEQVVEPRDPQSISPLPRYLDVGIEPCEPRLLHGPDTDEDPTVRTDNADDLLGALAAIPLGRQVVERSHAVDRIDRRGTEGQADGVGHEERLGANLRGSLRQDAARGVETYDRVPVLREGGPISRIPTPQVKHP